MTETSGKRYILWTLDGRLTFALFFRFFRLRKRRQSRVHKTYCFPRSQSISVNCYMLENEQSHRHPLCSVKHVTLNISTRNRAEKFSQRRYIVNLSALCNAIQNILDKFTFIPMGSSDKTSITVGNQPVTVTIFRMV